jgi:hypothetical protein
MSTINAGPRYLLNTLAGQNATIAYSLRRLRSSSQAAIRVRRSNDNAEQEIGFDINGNLDITALTTFVGANSGFVTTWYDQSSNAINATQTTAAIQPRIVNAGNLIYKDNDLVIEASPSQYFNQSRNLAGISFTLFFLLSRSGTGNDAILIASDIQYAYLHYGTTVYIGDGTTNGITLNTTQTLITLWTDNVASSRVYRNNVSTVGGATNNRSYATIPGYAFRSSTIFMSEFILYESNQFNNINTINTNINNYYRIY